MFISNKALTCNLRPSIMEDIKNFLDISTIHGLAWISITKRWSRLFWILVVIAGFTTAIFMIHESFSSWEENPITTRVETLPISEITFPNVTICPPQNFFLDLNDDLLEAEKFELDNNTRAELLSFMVTELTELHDQFYDDIIKHLRGAIKNIQFYLCIPK